MKRVCWFQRDKSRALSNLQFPLINEVVLDRLDFRPVLFQQQHLVGACYGPVVVQQKQQKRRIIERDEAMVNGVQSHKHVARMTFALIKSAGSFLAGMSIGVVALDDRAGLVMKVVEQHDSLLMREYVNRLSRSASESG